MIGERIAAGRGWGTTAVGAVMAGKKAGEMGLATKTGVLGTRGVRIRMLYWWLNLTQLKDTPPDREGPASLSCRFVSHVREASNKLTQPRRSDRPNALSGKQIPGLTVWHDSRNCWI